MKYYDRYFYGNWEDNNDFIRKDVLRAVLNEEILNIMGVNQQQILKQIVDSYNGE